MSRQKKSRRLTDIMPARKADKPLQPKAKVSKGRKPTRYELDLAAREEKKNVNIKVCRQALALMKGMSKNKK